MNRIIIFPFLFLFFVLTTCPAFSEVNNRDIRIDSLRKELNITKGSDLISTQLELALQIIESDKPEALRLAEAALSAARIKTDKNLKMRAYYVLGRIHFVLNNDDLSMAHYDTALILSEATGNNWDKGEILFRKGLVKHDMGDEINALKYFNSSLQACRLSDNFRIMGSSYSMMGTIFRINGLYDRAIEYIINSKLNYEKAGYSEGYAWGAYLLGRIYSDLKNPEKALENYQESLEIYIKMASIDGNQNGVAICYEQIGLINLASGNFKEAQNYFDSTLIIHSSNKSEFGQAGSHKNLGILAYSMGDCDLAEYHLNEALKVKKEIIDIRILPTIYEHLGLCLIRKGQTEEGFKNLQHALTLAISNNQKKIEFDIYSQMTKAYLSINELENAISCQKKQIEIQDQMLYGAANIKFEQLQTIVEIDKQNGHILELEKQNVLNALKIKQHKNSQLIMITGILIALLFSISLYWFYNKIRHKNRELKEINAAKDKLFAIIGHDLRGPTVNLTLFLEHLNETFNEHSTEELKKLLLALYKSAENVSILLENLLFWAKSQLNKIEYIPAKLKLTDALQTSITGLKQTAESKEIDIRFDLNDQIFVLADPNMVQTIMRNIISNAIKFTRRGGSITIKTAISDMNNALISITDTGVGIDQNALPKIFDISSTFHTKGTENEKSTGLGLIIVKEFIEKNKGTITIESEKGKGTIVSFTLPTI